MLFDTFSLRNKTLRNRIAVSPMCQYSSEDGQPNEWHFVHLGSRAVGGAALVIMEASAVAPEGRISPSDMGIWSEAHADRMIPITQFIRSSGSLSGIQLAHAGRKASTPTPWDKGKGVLRGWQALGPTSQPFDKSYPIPKEMSEAEISHAVRSFVAAAKYADRAGFDVCEIHSAHGYLLHSFLSPLVNKRADGYGGSFENRTRFVMEVATQVRAVWPKGKPLFVRLSCTDWVEGGWNIDDSIRLSTELKNVGVDLIDCSSGGAVPGATIPVGPGYQVEFASRIRKEAKIATGAVGLITDPHQAEKIIKDGHADIVLLARELLRDPYWPYRAAKALGATDKLQTPNQYLRGWS